MPETGSDNGGGDEEATIYAAKAFYEAALQSVAFFEPTPAPTPAPTPPTTPPTTPLDDNFLMRIDQMHLNGDGSEEQGDSSDDESYGKVDETASYRVLWFSIFGLGLWLKLGFPSICFDYSLMGFYLWGCSRSG